MLEIFCICVISDYIQNGGYYYWKFFDVIYKGCISWVEKK